MNKKKHGYEKRWVELGLENGGGEGVERKKNENVVVASSQMSHIYHNILIPEKVFKGLDAVDG